jgi:hypothetical protein
MNTSTINLLRRGIAGALLAATIGTTGVAFAATSHADDVSLPSIETPAIPPLPAVPWVPWVGQYLDRNWHLSCGPGIGGHFQCHSS